MAQQLVDQRDMEFVIWEQFDNEKFLEKEQFETFNKKTCEMIFKEGRKIAINEILPTMAESEKVGLEFKDGEVKTPDCLKPVFEVLKEGEWGNLAIPEVMGGQGAPTFIGSAINEYFMAANWPLNGYLSMGNGTAAMIHMYGTEEQKEKYVKRLVSAELGGTMLLTESNAGSDVGALETTAVKNDDGTYSLSGNKKSSFKKRAERSRINRVARNRASGQHTKKTILTHR